jgi:acetyltransferase-like isoleucine patch superfamily enzyme
MKGEKKRKPDASTMTKEALEAALEEAVRYPHKHFHKGRLIVSPQAYETPGLETNLVISPFSILDCTGSIRIGPWCNIGSQVRIYTHDTIHLGLQPLAQLENDLGVLWQDKEIGSDVWIHDGSIVLCQATHLPDGFVLGAGSVLTKNPGPFELWAGNPARKVGERQEMTREAIERVILESNFRLKDVPGNTE